jgi:phosphatidylinositol kinase/protein kinase (PI-3  family)
MDAWDWLIIGVFRKAAEISMAILRANSDSLMSVLEAFAHDPLVEWQIRSVCAMKEWEH